MKERGILFQGAMVRALLAGTKTQTRRAVKWREVAPGLNLGFSGLQAVNQDARGWVLTSMGGSCWQERCAPTPCPYGQPGDRLWVRERGWMAASKTAFVPFVGNESTQAPRSPDGTPFRSWPSIHMPRWASRITLEITGVRVERLQAISHADAQAEGIVPCRPCGWHVDEGRHFHAVHPRQSYFSLWEAINGAGSVEANPWVWAVEFRRVQS